MRAVIVYGCALSRLRFADRAYSRSFDRDNRNISCIGLTDHILPIDHQCFSGFDT
jgi:hypothetical protein